MNLFSYLLPLALITTPLSATKLKNMEFDHIPGRPMAKVIDTTHSGFETPWGVYPSCIYPTSAMYNHYHATIPSIFLRLKLPPNTLHLFPKGIIDIVNANGLTPEIHVIFQTLNYYRDRKTGTRFTTSCQPHAYFFPELGEKGRRTYKTTLGWEVFSGRGEALKEDPTGEATSPIIVHPLAPPKDLNLVSSPDNMHLKELPADRINDVFGVFWDVSNPSVLGRSTVAYHVLIPHGSKFHMKFMNIFEDPKLSTMRGLFVQLNRNSENFGKEWINRFKNLINGVPELLTTISFRKEDRFKASKTIESSTGLSKPTLTGRWVEMQMARLNFSKPLPKTFEIALTAKTKPCHTGEEFVIKVGKQSQTFSFSSKDIEEKRFVFKTDGKQKTLRFRSPHPIQKTPKGNAKREILLKKLVILPISE